MAGPGFCSWSAKPPQRQSAAEFSADDTGEAGIWQ